MKLIGFFSAAFAGLMLGVASEIFAGMMIDDALYFSAKPPQIIFPGADVKLVTFEFEAAGNDERGKRVAKELHNQFLKEIHDLEGGAILTYVAPSGKRLDNYRVEAVEVAKGQQAQMALWGRIALDQAGIPLINARLQLIQPPPGISASYRKVVVLKFGTPIQVEGRLADDITQVRLNFNTLEKDVTTLANFLSGLSRYYKGMKSSSSVEAKRWLESSMKDFDEYVKSVPDTADPVALAIAHTYLARGQYRLAETDAQRGSALLERAASHASQAAKLNPYDPDVPTVQAVIAAKRNKAPEELRPYLVQAASLAPANSTARINLALANSASAKFDQANQQLSSARFVNGVRAKEPLPDIDRLQETLSHIQSRYKER
jgi:hypothetical protein